MPLTGRTTVTPDLKGCLEEVSRIAAGAGTRLQQHDHQKEPAEVTATGYGPLESNTQPRATHAIKPDEPKITAATAPKRGEAREVNAWVTSR